jgi:hypothetical protein
MILPPEAGWGLAFRWHRGLGLVRCPAGLGSLPDRFSPPNAKKREILRGRKEDTCGAPFSVNERDVARLPERRDWHDRLQRLASETTRSGLQPRAGGFEPNPPKERVGSGAAPAKFPHFVNANRLGRPQPRGRGNT